MESAHDQQENTTPVDESSSSTGASRNAKHTPRPTRVPKRARTLIDTVGPEPTASLDDVRLTIGVIGGTHGVHGELKLKLLTDHPEHIPTLKTVFLGDSTEPTALLGVRFHGDLALIQLEGVTNPEEGKRFGGLKVRIAGSDALPLQEGEYFLFQLVGLVAETEDGQRIGVVTDIMETGAHDVLVIATDSEGDLLVPNHPEFVREISPERNRIVIAPPVYSS